MLLPSPLICIAASISSLCLFHVHLTHCLLSFHLRLKKVSSSSNRASLLVINSVIFFKSVSVLISPSFLKDSIAGYRILC